MQLNPRGELPILTDVDNTVIHEESAMLMYVENYYPENPMMSQPTQENRRDYAYSMGLFNESIGVWANFCRTILSHLMNEKVDKKFLLDRVKEFKSTSDVELSRWEKLLVVNGSDFLGGKAIQMVDIAFFPYLAHLVRYGLDLSSVRNFSSIAQI